MGVPSTLLSPDPNGRVMRGQGSILCRCPGATAAGTPGSSGAGARYRIPPGPSSGHRLGRVARTSGGRGRCRVRAVRASGPCSKRQLTVAAYMAQSPAETCCQTAAVAGHGVATPRVGQAAGKGRHRLGSTTDTDPRPSLTVPSLVSRSPGVSLLIRPEEDVVRARHRRRSRCPVLTRSRIAHIGYAHDHAVIRVTTRAAGRQPSSLIPLPCRGVRLVSQVVVLAR